MLTAVVTLVATLQRASSGAALVLVAIPFDFAHRLGPTTVSLPKAVLVGLAVGLALNRTSLEPLRDPRVRALAGGAIALVVVTALTLVPATFADPVARETFKAFEYLAIFVCALLAFAAEADDGLFWRALAIATGFVCAVAIVQEFTIAPSGLFVHGKIVPRIAGPLEGPNQLAGYLDVATTLLAARALLGAPSYAYGTVAIVAVAVDALTISRAGGFGLASGLLLVVAFAWRGETIGRARIALAYLVVPIAALATVYLSAGAATFADASARLGGTDESSAENGLASRGVLWRAAWRMFARDPALGVGAGNYEFLTPTVGLIGVRTHANSVYLQSLAEGGVALFATTVWIFVAAFVTMFRARRSALTVGVAAGTLALAVHEIFDTLTFFPKVGDLWWLVLGAGAAAVVRDMPARR